jgi:hypothetical protein
VFFYIRAEEINLNYLISTFGKNSNFFKKLDNEVEKAEIEQKGVKENNWKKVDFKLESSYTLNYYGEESLEIADTIKKGLISSELEYKGFFIQSQFDYTIDRYEVIDNRVYEYPYYYTMTKFGVGYKKVLNDFFYSEYDYDKKSSNLKLEIAELSKGQKLIEKEEELIDKYVEILNLEAELLYKEKRLEEMKETNKILEKKIDINESTKIDFEILICEMDKLNEEIVYQKKTVDNKKKEILDLCGLDYKEISFEEIKKLEIDSVEVNKNEIDTAKLQIELEEETLKYIKRQNQWPVELYAMYETIEDDYQIGINFNINLFDYRIEKKQKLQDIETKKIELSDAMLNYENKVKEREAQYEYLKKNSETLKNLSKVYEKKYKITKTLYEAGDIGLLDYLKTQTETYQVKSEFQKGINNYYGLLYKIFLNMKEEI